MHDPHFDHLISQLDAMNQRGGRMLSLVDLVRARSLSLDCAAHLATVMAHGGSLLCGARPGGAGKTTVMAALLGFVPPGTRLVRAAPTSVLTDGPDGTPDEPVCYVAHEIGSGSYHAYIWGPDVERLLQRAGHPYTAAASNLHADTLSEIEGVMDGLGVAREALLTIDLVLELGTSRSHKWVERAWQVQQTDDHRRHEVIWEHDRFDRSPAIEPNDTHRAMHNLLAGLVDSSTTPTLEAVRRAWLATLD